MPEVKYCKGCKKMFNYFSGPPLCSECKQADEDEFKKVKDYLSDLPGANLQEVSTATEVSPTKINRWLKEGRLEVSETSAVALNCEKCGARIRSGRFCQTCTRDLARDMMNAGRSLEDKTKPKNSSDVDDTFGLYYKHREEQKK